MNAKFIYFLLCFLLPSLLLGADREYFDFNFDGESDYRLWRESNGRLGYYDVYLYSQKAGDFVKHEGLSRLFNPVPKASERTIECFWPGGHAGAIHYIEVYEWDANRLLLKQIVRQTDITVDGRRHYVRVTASVVDGKPHIDQIEHIDPEQK